MKVAADRFDSRMQTLPREDFPTLPESRRHAERDAAAQGACKEMVAKTQFAITGEDTRYFLNGALFVLRPDAMSLVATDGHRLALVTVEARRRRRRRRAEEIKAILPKKTLRRARRGCWAKATATSATSAARTTCSSRSAAACSSRG